MVSSVFWKFNNCLSCQVHLRTEFIFFCNCVYMCLEIFMLTLNLDIIVHCDKLVQKVENSGIV